MSKIEELFDHVTEGNYEKVQNFLATNSYIIIINVKNKNGETIFDVANKNYNINIAKLLLQDVSYYITTSRKKSDILELELKLRKDSNIDENYVKIQDIKIQKYLQNSIENKDLESIKLLTNFDSKLASIKLLIEAIKMNDLGIVKLLVENGAIDSLSDDDKKLILPNIRIFYGTNEIKEYLRESIRDKEIKEKYRNSDVLKKDNDGKTILFNTVKELNFSDARHFIERGANVNEIDDRGLTPLHYVIMDNKDKMVKFLLENKADPNKVGERGSTPLHYAARANNREETIKLLLQYNARKNVKDDAGKTPLHYAKGKSKDLLGNAIIEPVAVNADAKVPAKDVREPVSISPSKAKVVTRSSSDLYYAVLDNRVEEVRKLLKEGADANEVVKRGLTLLHYAAKANNEEIFKLLLQYDAKIDVKDDAGKTPLEYFTEDLLHGMISKPINADAKVPAKDVREPVSISPSKAKVVTRSSSDLYYAVLDNRVEEVRKLLKEGADANEVVKKGLTLLHYAAKANNEEIFKLLLQYDAKIDVKDDAGKTPLEYFTEDLLHGMISKPINADAKMPAKDVREPVSISPFKDEKLTALYYAIIDNDSLLMAKLIKDGGDLNQLSEKGLTLLHYAAMAENIVNVKYLLQYGAKIHINDDQGKTPLDYATKPNIKIFLEEEMTQFLYVSTKKVPVKTAKKKSISPTISEVEEILNTKPITVNADIEVPAIKPTSLTLPQELMPVVVNNEAFVTKLFSNFVNFIKEHYMLSLCIGVAIIGSVCAIYMPSNVVQNVLTSKLSEAVVVKAKDTAISQTREIASEGMYETISSGVSHVAKLLKETAQYIGR